MVGSIRRIYVAATCFFRKSVVLIYADVSSLFNKFNLSVSRHLFLLCPSAHAAWHFLWLKRVPKEAKRPFSDKGKLCRRPLKGFISLLQILRRGKPDLYLFTALFKSTERKRSEIAFRKSVFRCNRDRVQTTHT